MKKSIAKSAALVFCALLLIAAVTACGGDKKPAGNVTTAAAGTNEAVTTEAVTEELKPDLPDVKFDGETFKILSRSASGAYSSFTNFELYSEGYDSELINDAVYDRNLAIEEKYGISITQYQIENPRNALQTSVMAGDHAYDVVVCQQNSMSLAAMNGQLYSLYEVPHIDLSKPWWDQNSVEGFSVANELYFASSDWLLLDKQRTMVLFFNKDMANDFNCGNLYKQVLDGKWTLDAMNDMMLRVANDENGNGTVDLDDRFGIVHTSNDGFVNLFYASGNTIVTKDADDIPTLNLYTDHANATVDKLVSILRNDKVSVFPTDYQTKYTGTGSYWSIPTEIFIAGRSLFYAGIAASAQMVSNDSEFEVGIIPYPKFDESQEKYYTTMQPHISSVLGVPVDSQSLEMTGVLLEDLSYNSMNDVLPIYYEEWLKVRYTSDDESAQMLDLIYDNIVYDLGMVFDWGGAWTMVKNTVGAAKTNVFSSSYAAKESAILSAMETTINEFVS